MVMLFDAVHPLSPPDSSFDLAMTLPTEVHELDHTPPKSPARQATQSRPFVCLTCNSCFRRVDHLKRHTKLHANGKHYRCPCGDTFSRNDVLAQHLGRCTKTPHKQAANTLPQTRSKRACDQCARSKMKCDYQRPCARCTTKKVVCEFTRPGYEDPYKQYGIRHESGNLSSEDNSSSINSNLYELPSAASISHIASSERLVEIVQNSGSLASQSVLHGSAFFPYERTQDPKPTREFGDSDCLNLDYLSMDFDGWPMWDWNTSRDSGQQLNFDGKAGAVNAVSTNALSHIDPPLIARFGYSMEQLDPLEAKCADIRSLLKDSQPLVIEEMITAHINRDKLLLCVQLYGKLFQRNYPILHSPKFKLVDTPSILLLAMMLTGACYSDVISNEHITRFCMSLLILIEKMPHEIYMQTPSLSTIQASIIICGILVCSRNEIASKFVSVYFARNISMANRAGIFDEVRSEDYTKMTEDAFDWSLWIEQESRKRMACEILSQDMAACIFQGKPPSLSPLMIKVELPCYEACWEAQTSSECFQLLQKFPQQIQIATTYRALRTSSFSIENTALFEASSFGMSTLILSLHGFLFQTIQDDINPALSMPSLPFSVHDITSSSTDDSVQLNHLKRDLSGDSVALYADSVVSRSGSIEVKRANAVLNAWHSTWEARHVHEYENENITFKGDPLRFWWLAKLLLVAHVQSHVINQDGELAIPSPNAADEKGKIALQTKLVKWLARFRREGKEVDLPDEVNILSELMKAR